MNLDKLKRRFDFVINNLTDEQWDDWYKNRVANRILRREALKLKCKLHFEKINK